MTRIFVKRSKLLICIMKNTINSKLLSASQFDKVKKYLLSLTNNTSIDIASNNFSEERNCISVEDYYLWLQLMASEYTKYGFLHEELLKYRIVNNSVSECSIQGEQEAKSLYCTLKFIIENSRYDLYDQARISYSLTFIYNNFGNPKKSLVSKYCQSDQFGIHCEMYLLFGFGSVFLFYFIGFVFKFIYTNIRSSNLFILTINKVFVVLIFFIFIKSFGIDWLLYDIIVLFITLHISAFFLELK